MNSKVRISFILSMFSIVLILFLTILNTGMTIYNPTKDMTATIVNEVEPYNTEYIIDSSIPSTADQVVIEEGINGLNFTYDGLNYVHLSDMKNEVVKIGTGKAGNFTGKLTGYGPDCPGCSKVGNVACRTKAGKKHSLINDGIYYNDDAYGKVRILAADNSAFPCGTIVKINNGHLNEFYGVVLDTGSSMRGAWKDGTVWMDLAFSSQKEARIGGATSSNTKFSVQRWGW